MGEQKASLAGTEGKAGQGKEGEERFLGKKEK